MQVGWLAFFLVDAVHKFWYNYWLLVPCFVTGGSHKSAPSGLILCGG